MKGQWKEVKKDGSREAPLLQYDAEQNVAANEGGSSFFQQLDKIEQELKNNRAEMASDRAEMNDKVEKLEAYRQGHLDLRQKCLSTRVRDALGKDTEGQKQEIRRLNKEIVHGGDVRSDAMVVTERFSQNSTERKSFSNCNCTSISSRASAAEGGLV